MASLKTNRTIPKTKVVVIIEIKDVDKTLSFSCCLLKNLKKEVSKP